METTEKIKIAYYLRNSTSLGNQDYEFQKQSLDSILSKRNDVELTAIYGEQLSGKLENIEDRPELMKLMQAVQRNEINQIWCFDVKRLARENIVFQTVCRDCTKKGVNIYFQEENINTLTPKGDVDPMAKMILNILGNFAEQDREQLLSKVSAGKLTSARAGNYTSGTLPTGYTYINARQTNKALPKRIVVDPSKKRVVEYIFNAIGNDKKTCNQVANELNNLKNIDSDFLTVMETKGYGVKNNKWLYNSWTAGTVKAIVNCTWYALGWIFRIKTPAFSG